VNETTQQGVGVVVVTATGEMVGQYGYEITWGAPSPIPVALQVDIPVAIAVRCMTADLSMTLEAEDGSHVVFVVESVGAGGADLRAVATRP
jgi:hypothetical protein